MTGGAIVVLAIALLLYAQQRIAGSRRELAESKSRLNSIEREIESERREASLKIRDEIYRRRREFEDGIRRDRQDLDSLQKRLHSRDDDLQNRIEDYTLGKKRKITLKEIEDSGRLSHFKRDIKKDEAIIWEMIS